RSPLPASGAAALGRQPLRVGSVTSHSHLVCRPAHERCACKRSPLRVGIVLQAIAPVGGLGHSLSLPCRWLGCG
ncbi:hypothetical protein BHE74_00042891, partial [Ensete ventricosum]